MIKKIIVFILLLGLIGTLCVGAIFTHSYLSLPSVDNLKDYRPSVPSKIISRDGEVLSTFSSEKREVIPFYKIPKKIVSAFVAAEDSDFFEHPGVDLVGIARAMVINIKAMRFVQGGSTITQQVAKTFLLTSERSIIRKIKDFLLALKIEEKYSKQEILYLYLNQVYLGGGYYGIKAAFEGYFQKEIDEISTAEAALVAGLLSAPSRYSPYVRPKLAKQRQAYVLRQMLGKGLISQSEYSKAKAEKIKFYIRTFSDFKAGHFTDHVRQLVIAKFGKKALLRDGLTIKTTLDWRLQQKAEEAVEKGVKEIDKRQGFAGAKRAVPESEITDFLKKQRKKIFKNRSQYFTINEKGEKKYEVELLEDEITLYFEEQDSRDNNGQFYINGLSGNSDNEALLEYITKGKVYDAVVLGTNNSLRVIFVSIGGLRGIISYDGFKWAHPRNIQDSYQFYPFVQRPSEILKKGDIVRVRALSSKTTLHVRAYKKAVERKSEDLSFINSLKENSFSYFSLEQGPTPEAASISMNVHTGEVLSLVGGSHFKKSQFNRALQSLRQPGSAFKPILYAAALEEGYRPSTIIIDSPEALAGVDARMNWKPRNYDGKFKGPMTLRNSLEQSRNITTIKMANDIGVNKIIEFSRRIGLDKVEFQEDLSISLGSFGVTLLDLVSTFAIFPSGGKKVKPKFVLEVLDREGESIRWTEEEHEDIHDTSPSIAASDISQEASSATDLSGEKEELQNPFLVGLNSKQVYDPRLSYIMSNLLKGVVLHGTGRKAKGISEFIGGKTGTTSNYIDAWFLGFSANIVTGVWSGMDNNSTLGWPESGSKAALPIWMSVMEKGLELYGEEDFSVPEGIVNIAIDKETGRPATASTQSPFIEAFVEGQGPDDQVDEIQGKDEESNSGQILEDEGYYEQQ